MPALRLLTGFGGQDEKKRDAACLGMRFRDLTTDERKSAGLETGGAKILAVVVGAEKAGSRRTTSSRPSAARASSTPTR